MVLKINEGPSEGLLQRLDVDDNSRMDVQEDKKSKHKVKLSKKSQKTGFSVMGLSKPIFNGIMRIGYKTPTPIQRVAIPVIQSGQDVVAMARTGSGKTACFLLPMFDILKTHAVNTGPRALILEPTRELAEQTMRFASKLGRFTGLHCTLVVGGDSMDQQFDAMHKDPDIIIATPGRLVHVCAEMGRRLDKVQYVVFDEADRLFEMGFREQLEEILDRLAPTRQTLLFSATLPKMLSDFAKAGLVNPNLVRLDKDDKLSEHLKLAFFSVAPDFKLHLLLYVLRCVVRRSEQVLVFAATQLHVQFLETVLNKVHLPCSYLYSDMDPTSRRINAAQFQKRMVNILIATDIAARGIDIPTLDYVINYNFPGSAKVFIHRVGRVARAGKTGIALNFVSTDEEPYLWDLHKFLGRSVMLSPKLLVGSMSKPVKLDMEPNEVLKNSTEFSTNDSTTESNNENEKSSSIADDWNFQFGSVPDVVFADEADQIDRIFRDLEIQSADYKKNQAYKMYLRSRPKPTREAIKEMRDTRRLVTPGPHPLLRHSVRHHITHSDAAQEMLEKKIMIMEQLKNVKLKKNIFEFGTTCTKKSCEAMKNKRKKDDAYIEQYQKKLQEKRAKYNDMQEFKQQETQLPQMTEEDIFYDFPLDHKVQDPMQKSVNVRLGEIESQEKKEHLKNEKKLEKEAKREAQLEAKKKREEERHGELANNVKSGFFIPYQPANAHTERGYSMTSNFSSASRSACLELQHDNHKSLNKQRMLKRKINHSDTNIRKDSDKKIKTESGRMIRASYKTERYEKWMKRNRIDQTSLDAAGGEEQPEPQQLEVPSNRFQVLSTKSTWKVHPLVQINKKKLEEAGTQVKEEVRNTQQVRKHRKEQKKYAEDRARGTEMKKIREKVQKGAPSKIRKGGNTMHKSRPKTNTSVKVRNKNKHKFNVKTK